MKYQQETIEWVRKEIEPLLVQHYHEVALNKDKIKYDPNWEFYYKAEQLNMFYVFTARTDAGKLVGYNCYFLNPHPHYGGTMCAVNDIFYVVPEYRGKMAGVRLLKFSEDTLHKTRGVTYFFMHVKPDHDFSAILLNRGYSLHEYIYSKVLD